jgi:hypothetical protein
MLFFPLPLQGSIEVPAGLEGSPAEIEAIVGGRRR